MTVGKPILVSDVLSKSFELLRRHPKLLLPYAILSLIGILSSPFSSNIAITLVILIPGFAFTAFVDGAYPLMVKSILDTGQLSIPTALRKSYHRFWVLLAAELAVWALCGLGAFLFIVPGIILLTWYAYTIPAIMLEDKGVSEGMAASKSFGRDKKWSTFLIALIWGLLFGALLIPQIVSPSEGFSFWNIFNPFLLIPLYSWISVTISYTYISYGPSSVPTPVSFEARTSTPTSFSTSFLQNPSVSNYCPMCGSRIQPGWKFCANCGQAAS